MPVRPIRPSEARYILDLLHERLGDLLDAECRRGDRDEDDNCLCSRCDELRKVEYGIEAVEAASEVVGREQGRAA